jgi:AbrB family looped-hinge helix DNA binding protein
VSGTTATVTSKGQVTIPAEVRDYMDVKIGDRLLFVRDAGRVYIERLPGKATSREVFGTLNRPGQPTLETDKARAESRANRARRLADDPGSGKSTK